MAKVTLTTPATVTMRDALGRTVYVPTAGQSFSIAEAGGVTTLVSVVAPVPPVRPPAAPTDTMLLAGSLNTITMADGHTTLGITAAGVIQRSGVAIPGGDGSAAVDYVPASNQVWGQDRATSLWWLWGRDMTNVSWSLPAVPYVPGGVAQPVAPPVVVQPVVPPVVAPVVPPVIIPPLVPPTVSAAPRDLLLKYLQGVTAAGKCLIGQTSKPTLEEFDAVTAAFGFSPAIMICDPWVEQWPGNAPFQPGFMPRMLAHAKGGGIVGMSLMLPNPITGGTSQDGGVDLTLAIMPGTTPNLGLNALLDQAAGLLLQFTAINEACLTRYMFELDGGWFWWGSDANRTNRQQTLLFHYITNYLRAKGLGDTILPTFAINGGPGTYEYPGDDVVDVVGIDAYTDTLAATYSGVYQTLRAQAPSKLFALTEDGSGNPSGPDRGFNEAQLALDIRSALPRACYANFWSGWGPNLGVGGKAAMSDPFWINLSQVALPAA